MNDIEIPIDLMSSIEKGECVLFVASGLSSQVIRSNGEKLPNWSGFLKELLDWSISKQVAFNSRPEEIEEMISKGNHLMAAEELQEVINPNDFEEFLNNIFRDPEVKPSECHNVITKIPFRAILTSNYDNLIEGAYTISSGGVIPKKLTFHDVNQASMALRKKDFFIFKMHGDLDRSQNIVLGSRSYNSLLYKSPEYLSFLETLFTTQTVLFIGFGGNDPDIDYLFNRLSTIFSRTLNKHYILTPNNLFNFTEKRRLLLDKRLETIEYDPINNHEQVLHLLSKLSQFKSFKKKTANKPRINVGIVKHKLGDASKHKLVKYLEASEDYELCSLFSYSAVFDEESIENFREYMKDDEGYNLPSIIIIELSEESLKSISFNKEVEKIILDEIDNKFKIITVGIGNIDIPFNLRKYQSIRIDKNYEKEDLEYIKAALERIKTQIKITN
ncbi:MAG: SIR2 family NAD-dependent protein deacylase [Bacteroidota bacterium]